MWIAGHTVRTSICFLVNLELLNDCISFNIGPINTKLENVANFNVLFPTILASCCSFHNKRKIVGSNPGRTNTRCLKITEKKVLPLQ